MTQTLAPTFLRQEGWEARGDFYLDPVTGDLMYPDEAMEKAFTRMKVRERVRRHRSAWKAKV